MENDSKGHESSGYVNGQTAADMQNERASKRPTPPDGETPQDDHGQPLSVGQRLAQLLRRLSGRHRMTGGRTRAAVLFGVLLLTLAACDTGTEEAAEQENGGATEQSTTTDDGATELSELAGSYTATVSDVRLVLGPDDAEARVDAGQLVIDHGDGTTEYAIRDGAEVTCDDSGCTWESVVGPPLMLAIQADADGPPFPIVTTDEAQAGEQPHSGGICGRHQDLPEDAWTAGELGAGQFTYTGMIGGGGGTCATFVVEFSRAQ